MKARSKTREQRRAWLDAECEKLRQEGNRLTAEQRPQARQHAWKIIYGSAS